MCVYVLLGLVCLYEHSNKGKRQTNRWMLWGTEGLSDTTAIRQRYEFLPPVCLLPYSLPISRENQDFLICTAIHAISNAYPLLHHFRWKERPRTYLLTAYWYSMQPTCTSIPHLTDVARGCGDIARRTVRRSNIILLHSPFSILCSLLSALCSLRRAIRVWSPLTNRHRSTCWAQWFLKTAADRKLIGLMAGQVSIRWQRMNFLSFSSFLGRSSAFTSQSGVLVLGLFRVSGSLRWSWNLWVSQPWRDDLYETNYHWFILPVHQV